MKTFKLPILAVMTLALITSCSLDYEDEPYSKRSYEKTFALLKEYIVVNELDQYELLVPQQTIDSLKVRPDFIGRIKSDLSEINMKVSNDMNNPDCKLVVMCTESQGAMIKKSAVDVKYEFMDEISQPRQPTRQSYAMPVYTTYGNSINFTSYQQVRTLSSISPGWGAYYFGFSSSTGKLSNGRDYVSFSGTSSINLTHFWYATNPNGDNTYWAFSAGPLGSGAIGWITFDPQY